MHAKKGKQFIIIEGTVCNVREIHHRDQRKTEKSMDSRSSLKRMNPGHKITQANVVTDFLSGYYTNFISKLADVELTEGIKIVTKCHKWVTSQNCEIVNRLCH